MSRPGRSNVRAGHDGLTRRGLKGSGMFSLGSIASPSRSLAIRVLAVALAVGPARGQPAPEAKPPELAAPAQSAPAQAPAPETAPQPAPVMGDLEAPAKPSANQAIRAALVRVSSESRGQPQELRALRRAVDAAYAERSDAPLWLDKGAMDGRGPRRLRAIAEGARRRAGSRAWRVYALDQGPEASLALADVALSEAVAAYAFQASGGRIDPSRISRLIGARAPVVPAAQALDEVSRSADAGKQLQSYNPTHPGYLALREKLAQLRGRPVVARLASRERSKPATPSRSPGPGRPRPTSWSTWSSGAGCRATSGTTGCSSIFPNITARLYRGDDARILDPGHRRQARQGDAAVFQPYRISGRQSVLEHSAIDHQERNDVRMSAACGGAASTSNGRTAGCMSASRPGSATRSAGSSSSSRMITRSICTTRRHTVCSPPRRAPSAMAACASTSLQSRRRPARRGSRLERGAAEKMYGKSERRVDLPAPAADPSSAISPSTVDEKGELRRFEDIYGYAGKARELLGLGG